MRLKFLYPHWGSESLDCSEFFKTVEENGFDGIEINIPKNPNFQRDLQKELHTRRREDFVFVAQQVLGIKRESPEEYLDRVLQKLYSISKFHPDFINSHTGKDYYSFEDNCRIIDAVEEFSIKNRIPVYHEIHRGRFTFHSTSTLNYLKIFPELKFTGDFSHWCVVSESLLQDQEEIIEKIAPNIHHLHARIGSEQASQVNNPFADEWELHLSRYVDIWKTVLKKHSNKQSFSITPEFGPFPYMPREPYTLKPLSDQQSVNIQIKNLLQTKLS